MTAVEEDVTLGLGSDEAQCDSAAYWGTCPNEVYWHATFRPCGTEHLACNYHRTVIDAAMNRDGGILCLHKDGTEVVVERVHWRAA